MIEQLKTNIPELKLRFAVEDDTELIFSYVKALAEYEKLEQEVTATEKTIRETLFGEHRYAEVILAEYQRVPAGFALFFHNYSTFLGKPGIYLEDLFITPEYRGKGIGRSLLSSLAKIAVSRNCGRLEWWVLDWNEKAIRFYKSIGGQPMDDWTVFRVTGEALNDLAR